MLSGCIRCAFRRVSLDEGEFFGAGKALASQRPGLGVEGHGAMCVAAGEAPRCLELYEIHLVSVSCVWLSGVVWRWSAVGVGRPERSFPVRALGGLWRAEAGGELVRLLPACPVGRAT